VTRKRARRSDNTAKELVSPPTDDVPAVWLLTEPRVTRSRTKNPETVSVKKRVEKAGRKSDESIARRGRKRENWDHYYNDSKEKIAFYKRKLETANENGFTRKQI
jgi:hypothetical protein